MDKNEVMKKLNDKKVKGGVAIALSTIVAGVGLYMAYNKFSDDIHALIARDK